MKNDPKIENDKLTTSFHEKQENSSSPRLLPPTHHKTASINSVTASSDLVNPSTAPKNKESGDKIFTSEAMRVSLQSVRIAVFILLHILKIIDLISPYI